MLSIHVVDLLHQPILHLIQLNIFKRQLFLQLTIEHLTLLFQIVNPLLFQPFQLILIYLKFIHHLIILLINSIDLLQTTIQLILQIYDFPI